MLASQGFGKTPRSVTLARIRNLAERIHAFQIDSVNVLIRAHYMPAFARLGAYQTDRLDALAYSRRELFEYWGHEASLLPVRLYPLLRYRMDKHAEFTRAYMKSEAGAYMARVYDEIADRGPLSAGDLADPGHRSGGWWGWWGSGNGKATLEHLYDAGLVAIAGRRGFERLYDLSERIIPRDVLQALIPSPQEAMKTLMCLSAGALGVGTLGDISGYFNINRWRDRNPPGPRWTWAKEKGRRRTRPIGKQLVSELVEEGRLLPAHVEGWKEPAYLHPGARIPKTIGARAFVTPFDSLVWDRDRMERLFGMKYTIEMYTPAHKRVFGYYVCPFLLGDTLVARCDLKADRSRGVLIAQGSFLEQGQDGGSVAAEMILELASLRDWLKLDRIEVARRGDLAATLKKSLKGGPGGNTKDKGRDLEGEG